MIAVHQKLHHVWFKYFIGDDIANIIKFVEIHIKKFTDNMSIILNKYILFNLHKLCLYKVPIIWSKSFTWANDGIYWWLFLGIPQVIL